MNLSKLRFDGRPQTWAIALEMAQEYLPGDGATYEHRYNTEMERRLLAVLLLAARRVGKEDFACVHEMAQKLDCDPKVLAEALRHPEMPEANLALEQILKSIGSLFCEPVKQLLLSLQNGRINHSTLAKT